MKVIPRYHIPSGECSLSPLKFFQVNKGAYLLQRTITTVSAVGFKVCFVVTIWTDLQLPNFRGQACASIGKSSRCMGHSA